MSSGWFLSDFMTNEAFESGKSIKACPVVFDPKCVVVFTISEVEFRQNLVRRRKEEL